MATQTPNYGLHQWEPSDNFLRTDFNTDFQKIDTALGQMAEHAAVQDALAQKAEIINGSYVGDGREGRKFTLGFKPRIVLIPIDDCDICVGVEGFFNAQLVIKEDGFEISRISAYLFTPNEAGTTYFYFALK